MPSFVCDSCQETVKKPKLDGHVQRCRNASFSCIDCYKSFKGTEYRSHFSCITEVQKYETPKTAASLSVSTSKDSTVSSPKADIRLKESSTNADPWMIKAYSRVKKIVSRNAGISLADLSAQLRSKYSYTKSDVKRIFNNQIKFSIAKDSVVLSMVFADC